MGFCFSAYLGVGGGPAFKILVTPKKKNLTNFGRLLIMTTLFCGFLDMRPLSVCEWPKNSRTVNGEKTWNSYHLSVPDRFFWPGSWSNGFDQRENVIDKHNYIREVALPNALSWLHPELSFPRSRLLADYNRNHLLPVAPNHFYCSVKSSEGPFTN